MKTLVLLIVSACIAAPAVACPPVAPALSPVTPAVPAFNPALLAYLQAQQFQASACPQFAGQFSGYAAGGVDPTFSAGLGYGGFLQNGLTGYGNGFGRFGGRFGRFGVGSFGRFGLGGFGRFGGLGRGIGRGFGGRRR